MLPITALMRSISVVTFAGSVIGVVLGVVAMVWESASDAMQLLDGGGLFPISLLLMLFSIIAYQLCCIHEAKLPNSEETDLMAALLAEVRAERLAESQAAAEKQPSGQSES